MYRLSASGLLSTKGAVGLLLCLGLGCGDRLPVHHEYEDEWENDTDPLPPGSVELRINDTSDDAEESASGNVSLTSTDLELVNDGDRGNQVVGLRFRGTAVPNGSTIKRAYLVFTTDWPSSPSSDDTSLTVRAQADDNAAAFTTAANDISSRALGTAQVDWSPQAWGAIRAAHESPDLAPLVQEVISRPGFAAGNAIAFVISGSGRRTAESFEGSSARAPLLHVEYEITAPPPPVCGDGSCVIGETCATCADDCGACPSDPTFRFAVIGDFGADEPGEAAVAALVDGFGPDFVVTLGDNNYPNGDAATIDANVGKYYQQYIGNYRGSYGEGSVTNRFWPTPGNHDWRTAGLVPYLDYFTLPGNERYYDVDFGVVHLYALDSDLHEPDGTTVSSTQAAWLEGVLTTSSSCWDIVVFHHPAYSSGDHGSTPSLRWPYATWGADAVLAGHDHQYERLLVDGIPYFVNGVGGAEIYSFGEVLDESVVRYNENHGAMLIEAQKGSITYSFYTIDGVLRDTYTVTKDCP